MNQPKNKLSDLLQTDETETSNDETQPAASEPQRKSQTAPSREGKVQVCAHINKKAHYQLHILRLETGKSIEQLMIDGLNATFTMHDKPPIA